MLIKFKVIMKKYISSELFPFFCFYIAWFIITSRYNELQGDDIWFSAQIAAESPIQWVFNRYTRWSSRMSIELALALINYNMLLWKLLNPAVATVLLVGISRYAITASMTIKVKRYIYTILCCLFFCMYPYVITSSVIWCTGSYNYLWAAAAFVFALLPFYMAFCGQGVAYKLSNWGFFFAIWFAAYQEQTVAILLGFSSFCLFYLILKRKKIRGIVIAQYVFLLVNAAICLIAPGPRMRLDAETIWYPNFNNLSLYDRIFDAIIWTNKHVLMTSIILTSILVFLIFFIINKQRKAKISVCFCISTIPIGYLMLQLVPYDLLFRNIFKYQNGNYLSDNRQTVLNMEETIDKVLYKFLYSKDLINVSIINFLPNFLALVAIICISLLLFYSFQQFEKSLIAVVIFAASLCSGYILFISPTIYASGSRIFFITDVLFILIIGLLLREIFEHKLVCEQKDTRLLRYSKIGLLSFSIMMTFMYVFSYSKGILWL